MRGDLLDLILLVLVVAFGVSGYRQGFIVGALSFIGFVGGGLLGVLVAPPIAQAVVDGAPQQALVAIVIVFLAATIGQFGSSTVGAVVRSHVTWNPARVVDAIGGTIASVLSVLLIAWIIGGLAVLAPFPIVQQQIKDSQVLRTVDQVMPAAVDGWFAGFKRFVDSSDFPQVFDGLGGGSVLEVPKPDESVAKSPALQRARQGIVKVQGTAPECAKRIEGTGFVYARERIMTNAHVVAGVREELHVTTASGRTLRAKVIVYNPRRDIAVLYVPGLEAPVLEFDGEAESRDDAIVAGFPRGRGYTMAAARIRERQIASGPDIYHETRVEREIYAIRGKVEPGNSGGPLLARDGRVFGVVFAAATDRKDTGYVLTAAEVRPEAEAGVRTTRAVYTQACDQ
ncbi:MarP family serine protease [Bailinhaonella thermotolerans]|uniref:Serine protease n=1 Tax=Bailinhaonella thermotolerans TaxID=1070861 RepID=A0A3A4A9K3_9ACTN|nr:MarP family serine protease [Bailinhaonella thermotolerans]RJL22006.1 serine protease [Bailinhaonella thermotolerans]